MRPLKRVSVIAFAALAWSVPASLVFAEDTKGKWQFGFGLSYYSTVDYIRSNADLAFATGVVGEGGAVLPNVSSVDDRPDINIMNQASIRDDFKLDFTASYGLTRWLALETAVGYMNSPVGNIEFYNRNVNQGLTGSPTDSLITACGPDLSSHCWTYVPQLPDETKNNTFLPIGTITEIPIHLSGLIRFRPESPFDPYIGLGGGYIIANLKKGERFNQAAAFFADPSFRVTTADEGEYTLNNRCQRENGQSCTDFHPDALEANVHNAWEWHAIGGIDYYMTERFSVYVDTRYTWTSGSIDIRTDHAHQVRFAVIDQGQLLLQAQGNGSAPYDPGNPDTWNLWEDRGVPANAGFHELCPDCIDSKFLETEDKNLTGALDEPCTYDVDGVPHGFCEDEGFLYQIPPGTRSIDESLRIPCPECAHNHVLDTEDANGNGYLDRYLLFGIDICTTPQGAGNPRCAAGTTNARNYVWPQGCAQLPEQLAPFAQRPESGCPPFPRNSDGTFANVGTTVADDAADTFIVQGGRIRMGGFSLGVGFKFSF